MQHWTRGSAVTGHIFPLGSAGWGQEMLFLSNSAQFQASAVLLGVTVLGQVAMGKG